MPFQFRFSALAVTGLSLFLAACGGDDDHHGGTSDAAKPLNLQVLYTNDHHSYFEGQSYDLNLDYDANQPGGEPVRLSLGGFPRIITAMNDYRNDHTLVLNNGELNGTLYFSLFKGEVDFKVFNTLGLDAYQLGNHEFDEGEAHLRDLLETANFPVITGNIRPTVDSPLFNSDIKPYVVKEIDGEKVAVIGVLKVEKTRESSLVTDAVEFDDEILSVRDHIYALKDQGINKFIVLSHLGYEFDQVLAENVRDIDVIIGGDTHNVLDSTGELAAMGLEVDGDYPTVVQDPDGKPVYIVQAWEYAKGLGRLNIDFDADGVVTDIDGNMELLVGGPYQVQDAGGAWVTADADQTARINGVIDDLTTIRTAEESRQILDILAPYKEQMESFKQETLGQVTEPMPFERIPAPFNAGDTPTGSYTAWVVADAFLKYLPKADVAIQNAGGVRAPLNDGTFTVANAYDILPFSNTVVTIDMTGAQIVKVLNEGLDYAQGISASTGAFPYAAGLRYDVTLGAPEGTGIENVEVRDDNGNWAPIVESETYSVATNSFTGQGKDGYVTFGEVQTANPDAFENSNVTYVVPLLEYFREELPDQTLPALDPNQYSLKSVTDLR
ncbi:MAG: 5'-nucleotidase C-terminal domain-containing protein [Alcanivorax sp.]|uniref:5'-nucleotidase C-terminal domain-containing protein n=1 Tax=Alloalcanivorax marinus TaxID=1177169 RepID=UPI00195ED639|nr:5'-nucleotidase C-terminal domain-containing protein [Alloalcanivorax marinus]